MICTAFAVMIYSSEELMRYKGRLPLMIYTAFAVMIYSSEELMRYTPRRDDIPSLWLG